MDNCKFFPEQTLFYHILRNPEKLLKKNKNTSQEMFLKE